MKKPKKGATIRTELMTKQELEALAQWRDECLARGRATGPVDRATTQEGITAMYAAIGKGPPQFLWFKSAAAGLLAIGVLGQLTDQLGDQLDDQLDGQLYGQLYGQLGDQLRGQLYGQLLDQLRGQLGEQLDDQLWDQLGGQLREQLWDQLGDQLRGQLYGQLLDQLWGQLRGQLSNQLSNQLRDQLTEQLYGQLEGQLWGQLYGQLRQRWGGQHYLYWVGWLAFARELGVTYSPELEAGLNGWLKASDTGWWWPFDGLCICTERPSVLSLDGAGRLHNESGMAMEFSDGWGFYSWHGVRVPQWVVMAPTLEAIAAEKNAEIRRCAIESYGWEPYLESLGQGPISTCPDPGNAPHELRLYKVTDHIIYDGPVNLLVMHNGSVERDGTRRMYAETVPADITNAVDAAAWRAGLHPDDYASLSLRT